MGYINSKLNIGTNGCVWGWKRYEHLMLIGLCGWPKAGKSEVTKVLIEQHGFWPLDTKYVLRQMSSSLTGLDENEFKTQEGKEKLYNGIPRRVIMGELGNVAEKLWGDDFMIRRALEQQWNYPEKKIVVDSLRKSQPKTFPGFVIQVISERGVDTGNDFDKFWPYSTDAIIVNDGTQEELQLKVANLINNLKFDKF